MKRKPPTKRRLNIKLLKRVKRAILAHPDQFQMDGLFQGHLDNGMNPGGCGWAACIGGWGIHLSSGNKKLSENYKEFNNGADRFHSTAKLFGISTMEIEILGLEWKWPEPFRQQYDDAMNIKGIKGAKAMAKVAAARIDHFIKHRK